MLRKKFPECEAFRKIHRLNRRLTVVPCQYCIYWYRTPLNSPTGDFACSLSSMLHHKRLNLLLITLRLNWTWNTYSFEFIIHFFSIHFIQVYFLRFDLLNIERKLNEHKTFTRCSRRLLNVSCTFTSFVKGEVKVDWSSWQVFYQITLSSQYLVSWLTSSTYSRFYN